MSNCNNRLCNAFGTLLSSPRLMAGLLVLAGAGCLATALTAQYVFGIQPCILCLIQRLPFAALLLLALPVFLLAKKPKITAALLALAALAVLAGGAVGLYQAGLEYKWWTEVFACARTGDAASSAEELKAQLMNALPSNTVPCDVVQWSLFGISFAGYNVLFSIPLAFVLFWAARRQWTGRTGCACFLKKTSEEGTSP